VSADGSYNTPAAPVSLAVGTYHWVVSFSGDANNAAPPAVTNETFGVGKATPTLTTAILQPNAAVAAGNVTVQDRATIAGGFSPTGTLTFALDNSANQLIAGTSFSTVVTGNGNYDTTPAPVSLAVGTYHWVVSFSGDANNAAPPAVTDETFTVGKAGPALTTTILQPTTAVTAGNVTVQDQATLSGGSLYTRASTLSFVLEDASNAAIAGTSFSTAVSANGSYDTPPEPVSLGAGTYHWVVSFSGDANNAAPPAVTNETFTVGKASPTLITTILQPTAAVTAGNVTVQDQATLSGGSLYTGAGTLDFVLEDASNAAIAGTSFSTSVSADGSYNTPAAPVSLGAGTYHWVVSFSGDANNNAPPAVTNETFTLGKASPTLTTTILQPTTAVTAGNVTVQDQATIAGGFNPTGTLTFDLDNSANQVIASASTAVSGNGNYDTPAPTFSLAAGTYHWVVTYSGDANNAAPPAVTNETFTVSKASPTLTTTILEPTAAVAAGNVTVAGQATITGGSLYTGAGTLSFMLEDASNAAVAGSSYSTTVSANGSFDTPAATVSLAVGTYHWVVSFSGDANNAAPPAVTNETFTVGKASPTLTTAILQPTAAVTAGAATVQDRATIAGGSLYTGVGTLSFVLDDAGSNPVPGTSFSTAVSANGDYDTPATAVSLGAGTYHWVVSFNGDANNAAPPDVTDETFTVGKAGPALTTTILQPTTAVAAGNVTVQDQAMLSGGSLYTGAGTVSFVLDDAGGNPVPGTSFSTAVSGDGSYDTTPVPVSLAAGTYHWVVSFSGDANNAAPPDVTDEAFTVGKASPTLTTTILQPTGAVAAGAVTVQDQATIAGGFGPSGTLTFALESSTNQPIAGTSFSITVTGDGNYDTPAAPVSLAGGTYHWVVSYSGDANNTAPPDVTNETFTVNFVPALTTTILLPTVAVTAGNVTVQDQATLSGGSLYTGAGTLDFVLEDASNAAIAGTSYATAVSANGSYDTTPATVSLGVGTYHWVVSYSGDANNAAPPVVTDEAFTVGAASPTLTTAILQPTAAVAAGNVTVQDLATIAGGFSPTGTLTFALDSSANQVIPGTTFSTPVSANGNYDTTPATVSLGAGTYHWVVLYTGDANNAAPPAVINETFTIGKASPTLSTTILQPTAAVTAGNVTVQDQATITGGFSPTGTLTFDLDNSANQLIASGSTTVSGNGNYDTPAPTFSLAAGTYHLVVSYTGDANNVAPPDVTNETFTVGKAGPTLTTTILQPIAAVTAGNVTVQDQATLSGGSLYTGAGTLSFVLEDAGNAAIAGTSFSTAVSANSSYDTPAATFSLAVGTYHWVVSYNGDANNAAPPAVTNETFTVGTASPTLTTAILQPNAAVTAGNITVQDQATLSGGSLYTGVGTLSFVLDDAGGNPVPGTLYSTAVSANDNYDTPAASVSLAAGTYHWVVSFSGDANNNAPPTVIDETFTVGKASPAISTTPNPTTAMLGVKLQDVANLTGGFNPTGSITFNLYAPNVNPAIGPIAYTETVTGVNGDGSYHTSVGFATNVTGVWHWVATYNGDSNNNSASSGPFDESVTIPPEADLALNKTVDNATPNVGDTVTFAITLTNNGPDTATNVTVSDVLPTGLTLLSSHPSQGTYVGGVWNVGTVTTSTAPTLTLTAKVVSPKAETNTATITHSDQFDPDPGNNSSSVTVTPPMVNLVLVKKVNQSQVMFGSKVTFTFVVRNLGPDTATGVVVRDPFPRGLVFVSAAVPSQGTYNPRTGVWTVGTLASGASATLRLTFRDMTMGPIVNTARASAQEFDPDLANNESSATVVGLNPAAVISKRLFLASAL
jgi:uncharacterized repeat protein (TIGR01451 family)